jgi:hypothetical protein
VEGGVDLGAEKGKKWLKMVESGEKGSKVVDVAKSGGI